MPEQLFRKRPVVVAAIQWTGDNEREIREWCGPGHFGAIAPEDRVDPEITAEVLDTLHSTWVGVKTGQWIIRGVKGDFCPIDEAVLAETYEPVASPAPADAPEPDYLPGYPGKLAKPPAGLFERAERAEVTAERIATYYLDHCGNCRDAEFYGATGRQADRLHERHVPVIEDGHGPLAGQPCACKACVPPAPGGSTVPILDPAERRTPEEWCEAYGLTVLDPDGWRVPSAPAWTDPVGLAEFYHRAVESTTNCAVTGAFTRIKADLDAWAADHA